MAHADPRDRLRNTLRRALDGLEYVESHRDGDRVLVLSGRRADGRRVQLRFLGLKDSESDSEIAAGSPLKLKSVGRPEKSVLSMFVPAIFKGPSHASRVRIEAGTAKLEIVCEDVEWLEDGAPA
jgi:hypothetical protein